MSEQYKPCPFCGASVSGEVGGNRWVGCSECCMDGPIGTSDEEAQELWNGRVVPKEVPYSRMLALGSHCIRVDSIVCISKERGFVVVRLLGGHEVMNWYATEDDLTVGYREAVDAYAKAVE